MYDSEQEATVRGILQICVHDGLAIVRLKDFSIFVRVVVGRAAARTLHLESIPPLLLEQVALPGKQVELFQNLKINGRLDELGDVEALLEVLFTLVIVLDGVLGHATLEVLNCNRSAVRQIEALQPGQAGFECGQVRVVHSELIFGVPQPLDKTVSFYLLIGG